MCCTAVITTIVHVQSHMISIRRKRNVLYSSYNYNCTCAITHDKYQKEKEMHCTAVITTIVHVQSHMISIRRKRNALYSSYNYNCTCAITYDKYQKKKKCVVQQL